MSSALKRGAEEAFGDDKNARHAPTKRKRRSKSKPVGKFSKNSVEDENQRSPELSEVRVASPEPQIPQTSAKISVPPKTSPAAENEVNKRSRRKKKQRLQSSDLQENLAPSDQVVTVVRNKNKPEAKPKRKQNDEIVQGEKIDKRKPGRKEGWEMLVTGGGSFLDQDPTLSRGDQ